MYRLINDNYNSRIEKLGIPSKLQIMRGKWGGTKQISCSN